MCACSLAAREQEQLHPGIVMAMCRCQGDSCVVCPGRRSAGSGVLLRTRCCHLHKGHRECPSDASLAHGPAATCTWPTGAHADAATPSAQTHWTLPRLSDPKAALPSMGVQQHLKIQGAPTTVQPVAVDSPPPSIRHAQLSTSADGHRGTRVDTPPTWLMGGDPRAEGDSSGGRTAQGARDSTTEPHLPGQGCTGVRTELFSLPRHRGRAGCSSRARLGTRQPGSEKQKGQWQLSESEDLRPDPSTALPGTSDLEQGVSPLKRGE